MMVLKNLFFVPWGWFMLNRYAKNVDNYTEGERYALLKKIVQRANKGGNITVQSYGVENIPNENGFMFYPNHQDCMMSLQLWMPARHLFFCSGKEGSGECSVSEAGFYLYEGIHHGQRGYSPVYAGYP